MLNIERLQAFAQRHEHRSWYRAFCTIYDHESPAKAGLWLKREQLKYFERLSPFTNYHPGKSGWPLHARETFLLRYPNSTGACVVCGESTTLGPYGWLRTCSVQCGAVDSQPRKVKTLRQRYGVSNPSFSPEIRARRTKTLRQRHGVDNAFQSPELMARARRTCLERYGEEFAQRTEAVKARAVATCQLRRGVDHHSQDPAWAAQHANPFTPAMLAAARRTCRARYGYDRPFESKQKLAEIAAITLRKWGCNPAQHPTVKARIKATMQERYGGHAAVENNGFRRTVVRDRWMVEHNVQGYEPRAIRALSRSPKVRGITTGIRNLPRIAYCDNKGNARNYYPDMYIKTIGRNCLIEVKSLYTLTIKLEENIAKFAAATAHCRHCGESFLLIVYCDLHAPTLIRNPTCATDLAAVLHKSHRRV